MNALTFVQKAVSERFLVRKNGAALCGVSGNPTPSGNPRPYLTLQVPRTMSVCVCVCVREDRKKDAQREGRRGGGKEVRKRGRISRNCAQVEPQTNTCTIHGKNTPPYGTPAAYLLVLGYVRECREGGDGRRIHDCLHSTLGLLLPYSGKCSYGANFRIFRMLAVHTKLKIAKF